MEIQYCGKLEGPDRQQVRIRHANGNVTYLKQRIVLHSPTGFGWGYGGSGPADLALNMLYDYLLRTKHKGARDLALDLHQSFKWGFIAQQTGDLFVTGKQIGNWLPCAVKLASEVKILTTINDSLNSQRPLRQQTMEPRD